MRRTIRLRENELRHMISETDKSVLRENAYDVSRYDDKKGLIFACLISGDEMFARTLLSDLSDSAINEIYNIVRELGYEIG